MIILKSGEYPSFFTIVGVVQDLYKGINFNELAIHVTSLGLELEVSDYLYKSSASVHPSTAKGSFTIGELTRPLRFEHLLQFVRQFFPGLSFQEVFLKVDSVGDYLIISTE